MKIDQSTRLIQLMEMIENIKENNIIFEVQFPELTTEIWIAIDTKNDQAIRLLIQTLSKIHDKLTVD